MPTAKRRYRKKIIIIETMQMKKDLDGPKKFRLLGSFQKEMIQLTG